MINLQRFFIPGYRAVYIISAASIAGTLIFAAGNEWLYRLLTRPLDIAIPIVIAVYARRFDAHDFEYHGTALYRRPNAVAFNRRKMVFAVVCRLHFAGTLLNNFLSDAPAIGISAAVLGMLSCALYPYGRAPMKFLFIHDVLRLPPFPYTALRRLLSCWILPAFYWDGDILLTGHI